MSIRISFYGFFLVLLLAHIDPFLAANPGGPVSFKLIHRNSISSPYYNPNASPYDLVRAGFESSIARARYYRERIKANMDGGATLIPDRIGAIFLANITIGNPGVEQLVDVDTGSSLLWVRCVPCSHCPKQDPVLFDPKKSSSYGPIKCIRESSSECTGSGGRCEGFDGCSFNFKYVDGTSVFGLLGKEKLVFGTSDDGIITVPVEVFGCALSVGGPSDNQESGIMGLGYENISLAKQLGGKFSMCFGNIHDLNYQYNKLIFGDGANLDGPTTPIVATLDGHYYISLEGISVGNEKLNIDPRVFKLTSSGEGGTFMDTGSTLMTLNNEAYAVLREKVQTILDRTLEKAAWPGMLCYKGTVDRDLNSFPAVSLHLNRGTDIVLDIQSFFVQANATVLCMAVTPSSPETGMTVLGVYAQKFYNFGYDVPGGKIYVQRIDCELLESW